MRIIANPHHHLHDPPFEILDGQITPYLEQPRRVEVILAALAAAGFPPPEAPRVFDMAPILAVHDAEYVAYLERAYARWVAAGLPAAAVLPSAMPVRSMRAVTRSVQGQAGAYCFDLSAPIVAGTFAAALGSARAALTGAALLQEGERAAYALCRPPGHHAARDLAGGYCFLNNAAIAAHALATGAAEEHDPSRPAVAVLDIDLHHGNGTQAIFYERGDVFVVSLHADPGREYPYFTGFADETGAGPGAGFNLNLPLPPGLDDSGYLAALETALAAIAGHGPRYLVVSAGVDTFAGDPLGNLAMTGAGFRQIGARIARLGLPTLFVQEGGYAVDDLGRNVVNLLQGFLG